jgi:hypothetical protein
MTENVPLPQRSPDKILCPECHTDEYQCDQEGSCLCANGHNFWSSNGIAVFFSDSDKRRIRDGMTEPNLAPDLYGQRFATITNSIAAVFIVCAVCATIAILIQGWPS